MTRTLVLAFIAAFGLPGLASAEIFRCQAQGASVSYQQMPCAADTQGGVAPIATDYPPVNTAERDRIFEREAAMYKRLEAERDRLAHLSAVRAAAPRVEAPAAEPEIIYVPAFLPGYGFNRFGGKRAASGIPRIHPLR